MCARLLEIVRHTCITSTHISIGRRARVITSVFAEGPPMWLITIHTNNGFIPTVARSWKGRVIFFIFFFSPDRRRRLVKRWGRAWKTRLVSLRNARALPSAHVLSIRRAPRARPRTCPPRQLAPFSRVPLHHTTPCHANVGIPGNRPSPPAHTTTFGFLGQKKISFPCPHTNTPTRAHAHTHTHSYNRRIRRGHYDGPHILRCRFKY